MRNVLYLSSFHPYAIGEMGAGEGIAGDNLKALLENGDSVDVVVNAPSYQHKNESVAAQCRSYTSVEHSSLNSVVAILYNVFNGAILAPWFFTRVTPSFVSLIRSLMSMRNYDYIHIEFPSMLSIAFHVKPETNFHYVAHDVVSQKLSRSIIKRFLTPFARRVESLLLSRIKNVYTLSEKDASLVSMLSDKCKINVINVAMQSAGLVPGALSINDVVKGFVGKKNVVFFGNMKRPENYLSIIWFLVFVWTKIVRKDKTCNFWILGIKPPLILKLLSKFIANVHVVGSVDDPVLAFQQSNICIAPLLFGAGVKIKVIQMIDAGAHVLATPIGAEGVSHSPRLCISNKSEFFIALSEYLRKC